MTNTDCENDLVGNDDLWGQLLGRKFDRISEDERTLQNLVSRFASNKKELVRYYHDSVPDFIAEIEDASMEEAEASLFYLYAEHEWRSKSTGTRFILENTLSSELDRLQEEGFIIRRLDERFSLVWAPEERRRSLQKADAIQSEVQTEAKPVFIRSFESEDYVEVRGPATLLDEFAKEFSESGEVNEVELEPTDEPILENLSTAFDSELSTLTLIEVKFISTNLPDGSSLALSNSDGIRNDLNNSMVSEGLIDKDNLADLDYFKFEHEKSGVQVKISVERQDDGFYFEINDSSLQEDEKKNVREVLEDRVGISFESLYPYDIQHHKEYIINQILTCNEDVYRKYYELLDSESQQFIDKFVDAGGQDTLYCYECNRGFFDDGDIDTCPDCGTSLLRGQPGLSIEIREQRILEEVASVINGFEADIRGEDESRLLQLKFKPEEIDGNNFIKSSFHLVETAGTAMDTHWYEYFLYCLGNGDIPSRVNQYLLDCVLITYGNSEIRGRDNYGTISLYEILEGEFPEKQFVKAVRKSQSSLRNRVRQQADDSEERLRELQRMVDDGTIEGSSGDELIELKAEYDYNDFEQDIFCLFKSMFLFTERWGREGKKETDGCLIIPEENGDYFVASFDPKLTYDTNGYDLNAGEKNKAAYYILSENNHEYISDVLKEGGSIDGHIFVSDIFKEGQFEHVAETVNEWFSLTQGADSIDVPVIFLSLGHLLDLYQIFDSQYNFIMEYPKVQMAFRTEIRNQLRTSEQYTVIDEDSVEKVEEKVLEARSTARKKKATKGYSDS